MEGWIKLHRQILENEYLWNAQDEPFDHRSAWIDLLLNANHKDKRIYFNGKGITVKAGQWITSLHKLSVRWHWSLNRVRNYLNSLEEEQMIIRESNNSRTLLTIVNYAKFQGFADFGGTPTDTPTDTPTNTPKEHQRIPNKNEKNVKNEKKYKQTPFMSGEGSKGLDEFIKMMEGKNDTE